MPNVYTKFRLYLDQYIQTLYNILNSVNKGTHIYNELTSKAITACMKAYTKS